MSEQVFAVALTGGASSGINSAIEGLRSGAFRRGLKVIGIGKGLDRLARGDREGVIDLTYSQLGHHRTNAASVLESSRRPAVTEEADWERIVAELKAMNVAYLVIIGGDGSLALANRLALAAGNNLGVAVLPKTIDNDLPLPEGQDTLGFRSARFHAAEHIKALMSDAATCGQRFYIARMMGRHAGHLALDAGDGGGASVTLIPEEFSGRVPIQTFASIITGSVLMRLRERCSYGVAVVAEGIADLIDTEHNDLPEVLKSLPRDGHGRISYKDVPLDQVLCRLVKAQLAGYGIEMNLNGVYVGYTIRTRTPTPEEEKLGVHLGHRCVDTLLSGRRSVVVFDDGELPFDALIDAVTGKVPVRMVNRSGKRYRDARLSQTRLSAQMLQSPHLEELAALCPRLSSPAQLASDLYGGTMF